MIKEVSSLRQKRYKVCMDRIKRLEAFKKVLEFATTTPLAEIVDAKVVDGKIEIRSPETIPEYRENHEFWMQVFRLICEIDPNPTLDSCTFFYQKAPVAVPLTRLESFKKCIGMRVEEKAVPGEIVEIEAKRPNLGLMDTRAFADGILFIGFDEKEYDRLKTEGLRLSMLMLPITHPYRYYIPAGHFRNLVLA